MKMAAIKISHLTVNQGRATTILHDLSISCGEGRIIGLIGPSGAGKTTLIRAIVGRKRLASGAISIFGLPAGARGLRTQVAYMTQQGSVYSDLTVDENLRYFAAMIGLSGRRLVTAVDEVTKLVRLEPQRTQLVATLSGGQRQRVSLAISLLGEPKLLVLDEPTVGLDPVLRAELWLLFRSLTRDGVTLIISSHAMDEAEHCDDLILLRSGRLMMQTTPGELKQRTHTTTIEAGFLSLVGRS